MIDVEGLKEAKKRAFANYEIAKANLEKVKTTTDPQEFQSAVQAANDAWLELKKMDKEVTNGLIFKKLGDLYGC